MKKFLLVAALAILSSPLFGQVTTGYHRFSQVTARATGGSNLVVQPYAKVYVTSTASGTVATIYSDPLLAIPIVGATVTADGNGNYDYFIPLGYCVNERVAYPGAGSVTTKNICVVSGTTTGVINNGTTGQLAYYAAGGNVLSGESSATVAQGGTGATTAAGALVNLGTEQIAQGGTGATTAAGALANLNGISSILTTPQSMAGPLTTPKINGVLAVDGTVYPLTGAGVQSAINDAITAGGGTVNARGVCNATFASEFDIGNGANVPINLLVPSTACTWTSTQTDVTAYGFRVFPESSVIGEGSGQGQPFKFAGSSAFRGVDLFAAHGSGEYGHLKGFTVSLAQGGVVSTAVAEIDGYGDNSLFESLTLSATSPTIANVPKVFYTHGGAGGANEICCTATFKNISAEAQNTGSPGTAGSMPCAIGSNSDITTDVVFDGLNCIHPGSGQHNLVMTGNNTRRIHFGSVYMETGFAHTDTTTAGVYITSGAGASEFKSVTYGSDTAGSTRWIVLSDSGTPVSVSNIFSAVSGNCLSDSSNGINSAITGNCFALTHSSFPTWLTNIQNATFQRSADATSGAATPSFGPDFFGGWWNSGSGATANKFGHIYCKASLNNVASLPAGECVIQTTNSAGALVDSFIITPVGVTFAGSGPSTILLPPGTYAALNTAYPCATNAGRIAAVSDSNSVVWGDVESGGSAGTYALVSCNGVNYTVIGK